MPLLSSVIGKHMTHWTESILDRQTCAHCDAEDVGSFCSSCGQRRLEKRLSLGDLLKDLFSRVTNLEKGLLYTFVSLMTRPSQVARDYISGRQRCYTNPLTYFFLAAALQLVSLWLMEDQLRKMLTESVQQARSEAASQDGFNKLDEIFDGKAPEVFANIYVSSIRQAYTYAALFAFVVPFATMLWIGHRILGEPFRFGEVLLFSLFAFAQVLVITSLLGFITARISPVAQVIMSATVYTVYLLFAHRGFFHSGFLSYGVTFFATVFSTMLLLVAIVLIFMASLIWEIYRIQSRKQATPPAVTEPATIRAAPNPSLGAWLPRVDVFIVSK